MSFDWKNTLATIAPTLATALGGPMAGVAVKMATKALGVESNEDSLESAITSGDPEILLKLKQVEKDFILEMRKLDVKETELDVDDRKSARQLFKVDKWPQIILSIVFVIGYFSVLYFLMTSGSDTLMITNPTMTGVFTTILGVLTAAIPQILNFWFGSSSGSKDKSVQANISHSKLP